MEVKIYNININGLNILLIPMNNTEIISVGMFIKIGSLNETKEIVITKKLIESIINKQKGGNLKTP